MNLLFTICGRAGSKGFSSKNCREFLGKPIVHYTLRAIDLFLQQNKSRFTAIDICLSTDSPVLKEQASAYGLPIFTVDRQESLSGDTVSKKAVICDALLRVEQHSGLQYDLVVDLDITSPLRTVRHLEEAITECLANPELDVVFSVTESRRSPYFNMVAKKQDGCYAQVIQSPFLTRQEAPELFDMNASIYAYRRAFMVDESKNFVLNGRCGIVNMMDTGILDIDSEHDFELLQVIAAHMFKTFDEYGQISSPYN